MGSGCYKSDKDHSTRLSVNLSNFKLALDFAQSRSRNIINFASYDRKTTESRVVRWKRGNLIGEGSYGEVYQAMNIDTGELLAVKSFKLSSNPFCASQEFNNIKRELTIMKSLDHLNVIKYFQTNYFPETKSINILMEYMPSGSMNGLIKKYKGFSEDVIRNYTKQLLLGLDYLHRNDIVHRDLKSANILVTEDGVVKLSDFGCSRKFNLCSKGYSLKFKGSPY